MQAIILAAGRGARLQHLTIERSKAMLPVVGKPMVKRVIESLAGNGIDEFILVVHPDDREIQTYFSQLNDPELRVRVAFQTQRLGMADALRCAAPLITDDFVLSACDSLIPAGQIRRLFTAWDGPKRPNAILTLMPVPLEKVSSTGIVSLSGEWVARIIEKPAVEQAPSRIASLPLYIFPHRFLEHLDDLHRSARGEYELQDAIQRLIDQTGRVLGVMVEQRLTVTHPGDLLAINRDFLACQDPPIQNLSQLGHGCKLTPPVYISEQVYLGEGCQVGPYVFIEGPATIGDGARLKEAVILRKAAVAENADIDQQVVS